VVHTYSFLPTAEYPGSMATPQACSVSQKLELKLPAQGSERQNQKSCKIVGSSSTGEGWGHNSIGIFSDENRDFFFI